MTTEDLIRKLFYRVNEAMKDAPKHPHASLWPSEVVMLGVLFALKGAGARAFYRWVSRDWRGLFPAPPERTRLFRLFATHRTWAAFQARLVFTLATFNLLVQWNGLQPDTQGFVRLSVAEFSL